MSEQAIGYFFTAFFGALAALVVSWIRQWIQRPRLSMEIDLSALQDFAVIDNELGVEIGTEKNIRLKINNNGKTPADYCEAKIEPLDEKGKSLDDPSILHWVRLYPENKFDPITINTEDHEFLAMIVIFREKNDKLHLRTASHRPFLFLAKTNYQFKVTVFSKNHNPIWKTFGLFWDGTWDGFAATTIRQASS
jgi:hypothetical protein